MGIFENLNRAIHAVSMNKCAYAHFIIPWVYYVLRDNSACLQGAVH